MEHDVFISHSAQDKAVADEVCSILETGGHRCWIASRDVRPGRTFAGEITRAIQQAKVMVLIFSGSSNRSQQVLREIQLAVESNLQILQFRIENVPLNDDLKYFLGTPQWLDAFTPPLEPHLERLASATRELLAQSQPPDFSQTKPTKSALAGMTTVPEHEGAIDPPLRKPAVARTSSARPAISRPAAIIITLLIIAAGIIAATWYARSSSSARRARVDKIKDAADANKRSAQSLPVETEPKASPAARRSVADVLAGHRWEVRSDGLACQGLNAVFSVNGTFDGNLENPPNDMIIKPQRVRGEWSVASPSFLALSYHYNDSLTGGPPATAKFMIQITEVSERKITGVQKVHMVYTSGEADETRLWEFERLD